MAQGFNCIPRPCNRCNNPQGPRAKQTHDAKRPITHNHPALAASNASTTGSNNLGNELQIDLPMVDITGLDPDLDDIS